VPGNGADAETAARETARASIQFPDYPLFSLWRCIRLPLLRSVRDVKKNPRTRLAGAGPAFAHGR
jgi:hypothetical protein